jgi:putative PIN family toxin of toxin-antitoxin system
VIRVVIDTSVLIRYLIKPSAAIKELIEVRWLGDQVQMVTAPELIEELESVLERDYIQALIHPEEGQTVLDVIHQKAESLPSLGEVPSYTRDPKDDKFVACALAGRTDYLVTEDRDILVLNILDEVRVVTPYDFVRTIPRQS